MKADTCLFFAASGDGSNNVKERVLQYHDWLKNAGVPAATPRRSLVVLLEQHADTPSRVLAKHKRVKAPVYTVDFACPVPMDLVDVLPIKCNVICDSRNLDLLRVLAHGTEQLINLSHDVPKK
mgnify:CR=1 FL=1